MPSISDRPLITFALIAYNQEQYITEAVQGAFSQTYSPLEIILSDDCSSDRTFEIMQEMAKSYQGPHTIVLNRNEKNLNIGGHVNRVMELAQGEWIVVAAGDDISLPERTATLVNAIQSSDKAVKAMFSHVRFFPSTTSEIKSFPTIKGTIRIESLISRNVKVTGCSFAWSKEIFEVFGPLHHNIVIEDLTIAFRASLIGRVIFLPMSLVQHRTLEGSVGRPNNSDKQLRYFVHHLNAYSQMLIDLNKYVQLYPQEISRVLGLSAQIKQYHKYFLIRIGRRFVPDMLTLRDYLEALGDVEVRNQPFSHLFSRLREILSSRLRLSRDH